jgi:hypothetical protein
MSTVDKELDDYLESIKRTLKSYVEQAVKERYNKLYSDYQELSVKMTRIEQDLKEMKGE